MRTSLSSMNLQHSGTALWYTAGSLAWTAPSSAPYVSRTAFPTSPPPRAGVQGCAGDQLLAQPQDEGQHVGPAGEEGAGDQGGQVAEGGPPSPSSFLLRARLARLPSLLSAPYLCWNSKCTFAPVVKVCTGSLCCISLSCIPFVFWGLKGWAACLEKNGPGTMPNFYLITSRCVPFERIPW